MLSRADLTLGLKLADGLTAPIAAEEVAAYCAASGDDNPLHADPQLARRLGYEAPPIPGMLLMRHLEAYLAARIDDPPRGLSCRFTAPAVTGVRCRFSGRVVAVRRPDDPIVLRLWGTDDTGRPVLVAEARY